MFPRRHRIPPPRMHRQGVFFPGQQMGMGRRGGLFHRFTPERKTGGFFPGPLKQTRSEGLFKSLMDPEGINQFLSTTQKVLNTTQQIGSMVQQYGPFIRNLPAMWKILKILKENGGDEKDETLEAAEQGKEKGHKSSVESSSFSSGFSQNVHGASKPKLYI